MVFGALLRSSGKLLTTVGTWCRYIPHVRTSCMNAFEACTDYVPPDRRGLPDQPDNLDLAVYNLNDRLNDPEVFESRAYDLIHSRFVAPGIKKNRWASYVRDMRILLRPGGWIQASEYQLHVQSNNGRLTEQSAVYRWWHKYATAMTALHRDPRIGPRLQEHMLAAGLRDVRSEYKRLPIGGWDPGTYLSRVESVVLVTPSTHWLK
jgi:hypothetical protein